MTQYNGQLVPYNRAVKRFKSFINFLVFAVCYASGYYGRFSRFFDASKCKPCRVSTGVIQYMYCCSHISAKNLVLSESVINLLLTEFSTVCPRGSDPLYIVTYYSKMRQYFLDIQNDLACICGIICTQVYTLQS